jgi:phosphoribosyl 1,2-cyclic phosphate phosphodiesterase
MRVTVLGCGGSTGVPSIGGRDGAGDWGQCDPAEPRNRRSRASIVIESGRGERLLIDTGPDLREQLLACRIPSIHAVLYTHSHADHITGLDEVRILNRIIGRPIEAHATANTLDELVQRFPYAFRPWEPPGFFRPVLEQRPLEAGGTVRIAGLDIALFDQDHGYTRTLGLRVGGFGYSTDVVNLDDHAFAVLAGLDTWLVSCFQRARHTTHANLQRVLEWVERLRPRRTILTHMGVDLDWAWLAANLPPGVEAAYDGMILDFA